MSDSVKAELEQSLDQAAAFVRAGDYTGAFARVKWAYEHVQRRGQQRPHPDPAVEELLRSAELTLPEYERLLQQWQEEAGRRHEAYLSRELLAINTFGRTDDEASQPTRRNPALGRER